jgi:hypothetical protein
MHAFEIMQTVHDRIVASAETQTIASMPRSVVIDAAFSLSVESGFYYLEYDVRGVPYRWTGPDPSFFFEVFVDRQAAATVRLRYSQIYSQEVGQPIQCYVDGEEIETTAIDVDGEFEVFGILPSRDSIGGTVLSFICPGVSSPSTVEQSHDDRQLGLAFRWLRIDPAHNAVDLEKAGEPTDALSTESKQGLSSKPRRRASTVDDKP